RREHDEGDEVERDPPTDRQAARDAMLGQRAMSGAVHALVDVAVEVMVERRRSAARSGASDERRGEDPERRHAASGEEHPAARGPSPAVSRRWRHASTHAAMTRSPTPAAM